MNEHLRIGGESCYVGVAICLFVFGSMGECSFMNRWVIATGVIWMAILCKMRWNHTIGNRLLYVIVYGWNITGVVFRWMLIDHCDQQIKNWAIVAIAFTAGGIVLYEKLRPGDRGPIPEDFISIAEIVGSGDDPVVHIDRQLMARFMTDVYG